MPLKDQFFVAVWSDHTFVKMWLPLRCDCMPWIIINSSGKFEMEDGLMVFVKSTRCWLSTGFVMLNQTQLGHINPHFSRYLNTFWYAYWSQQIRSFNHLFKTRNIGKWKKLELQVFLIALMEIKSLSQLVSCLLNIYNIFKRDRKHPWHSYYSEHQSNYRHHFPFSPSLSVG
jgi:hypothetical protein